MIACFSCKIKTLVQYSYSNYEVHVINMNCAATIPRCNKLPNYIIGGIINDYSYGIVYEAVGVLAH